MNSTEYNEEGTGIWTKTGFMHKQRYEFASKFVTGKKVLNIGCGPGYAEEILLKSNPFSITSIDYDCSLIEKLNKKNKNPKVVYKEVDAQHLNRLSEKFDVLISFENIEHLPEPVMFLNSIKNVITEGAILLLSTPNAIHYSRQTGSMNPYHVREWDYQELLKLLLPYTKSVETYGQVVKYSEEAFNIIEVQIRQLNSLWVVRFEKLLRKLFRRNTLNEFNFLPLFTEIKPISDKDWNNANTFLFHIKL